MEHGAHCATCPWLGLLKPIWVTVEDPGIGRVEVQISKELMPELANLPQYPCHETQTNPCMGKYNQLQKTMPELTTFERLRDNVMNDLTIMQVDQIKPTHSLRADLGYDSMDMIDLIYDIELEFEVYISEEELEKVRTVKQLVDLIDYKYKAG
jgi:acyl carrier protein